MTSETKKTHNVYLSWERYGSTYSVEIETKGEVTDYSREEIETGLAAGRTLIVDDYGCAIAQFHSAYRAESAARRGDYIIEKTLYLPHPHA